MFNYLLNRWLFARRFEKSGAGYVYRRRPDLPGIPLSEDEHALMLGEFRRRYWKWWFMLVGGAFAAACVIAGLAVTLDLGETFLNVTGIGLAIVLLGLVVSEQRRKARPPETRFAGRPPVPSALPGGSWLVRYKAAAIRRSWPAHAAQIVLYAVIVWVLTPRSPDTEFGRWLLFACFAIGLALLIFGAVVKVRQRGED